MNHPVFRIFWIGIMLLCVVSCSSTPYSALNDAIIKNGDYVNDNKATCGLYFTLDAIKQRGIAWGYESNLVFSGKPNKEAPLCTVCWQPSQSSKSQAKQECSKLLNGTEVFLLYERPYGDPAGYHYIKDAVTISENYWNQVRQGQERQQQVQQQQRERQQQVQQQQAQQRKTDDRASKCVSFGFQPNTPQYNDCMFELYKLEESARQNQAYTQSLNESSARQNAILQQQLEEQQFESGMRMLQNAADMINPPSTKTTCRYNDLMKKVTCN
jgi:hypothetical protein